MRKVIVVILAVLALVIGMAVPAFAAPSANVVITATPAYISVTQAQATWTLNGIDGDGITPKNYVAINTIYYANPTGSTGDKTAPGAGAGSIIVDGECYFVLDTSACSLNVDLKVNCGNFAGGGGAATNKDTDGSNGATNYGGFAWASGGNYTVVGANNKVIMKTTGSLAIATNKAPTATFYWGAQIETREHAWSSGVADTATMVITATATP